MILVFHSILRFWFFCFSIASSSRDRTTVEKTEISKSNFSSCEEPLTESHSVMSNSLRPHGLFSPWNSPGQNTGVGCLSFLLPNLDYSNPGIEPRSHTLQADSLPAEPQGKPKDTGVGSWSLLQWIFPTQESNQGLLHCKQILYQVIYQGSPKGPSVQSLSHVRLFATPWTAALHTSLIITNSWSLLKLMSIESVMPSNHLILCHPLLLLPSVFPSIRVFSNDSVVCIRWPKYWSFSFNITPSHEYSGLISFRMDWLDLLAVQGILKSLLQCSLWQHIYSKSLLQHHSSKASVLLRLAFFVV